MLKSPRQSYQPFSLSLFLHQQFYFLLPMMLVLLVMGGIDFYSTASNPFRPIYPWLDGQIYKQLDGFDDYANGLYYAVYLLILGVMVKSKSIPHRIFLRNFFVVQLLFTLLLVKGLKYAVGEPRPYAGDIASQPFSSDRQFHSFPSGHTAESIAAASPLAYYIKVHLWLVLWGFLPASIAFCRLYFAQHDVFDVLGSVVIGLMSSYIVVTHTEKQVRVIEPPFVFTPFSLVGFKKNAKKIKT